MKEKIIINSSWDTLLCLYIMQWRNELGICPAGGREAEIFYHVHCAQCIPIYRLRYIHYIKEFYLSIFFPKVST